MKKLNIKPTDAELEILQILWARGSASVKEVNEEIGSKLCSKKDW
jgi:predicted transcriptional regulator